jgi:hypothetical protein
VAAGGDGAYRFGQDGAGRSPRRGAGGAARQCRRLPDLSGDGRGHGQAGAQRALPAARHSGPSRGLRCGRIRGSGVGGVGRGLRSETERGRRRGNWALRPAPDPALRDELEDRLAREGLESLADELQQRDPEAAAKLDLRNPARVRRALERALDPQPPLRFSLPPFRKAKLALVPSADAAERRIAARLEAMLEAGWVEEVRALREAGVPREAPGMRAIGYRSLWDHVVGVSSLAVAAESIRSETRRYAKRQRTWLRSEPNLTVWEGELTAEQALRQVKERFRL